MENQANVTVKRMRSVNGSGFNSTALEDYLFDKGIIHELTRVEGPWQNPAEKENRIIVDKTRALTNLKNQVLDALDENSSHPISKRSTRRSK